jgi:hypothetical protein
VVVDSNTVVDPGAVVIITLHTTLANRTVLRSRSYKHSAFRTQLTSMYFFEQINEFVLWF